MFDLTDKSEDLAIAGKRKNYLFFKKYTNLRLKIYNLRDLQQGHCLTTNSDSAMDNKSNRGMTIEANNNSKWGQQIQILVFDQTHIRNEQIPITHNKNGQLRIKSKKLIRISLLVNSPKANLGKSDMY